MKIKLSRIEYVLIIVFTLFLLLALSVKFLTYYYPLSYSQKYAEKISDYKNNSLESLSNLRIGLYFSTKSKTIRNEILKLIKEFFDSLNKYKSSYLIDTNEIKPCLYIEEGLKECIIFFKKVQIEPEKYYKIKEKLIECEKISKLDCTSNERLKNAFQNRYKQYLEKESQFLKINNLIFTKSEITKKNNKHKEKEIPKNQTKIEKNLIQKSEKIDRKPPSQKPERNIEEEISKYFKDKSDKIGISIENIKFDKKSSKVIVSFKSKYVRTEVFAKQLKVIFSIIYNVYKKENINIETITINVKDIDGVKAYSLQTKMAYYILYRKGRIGIEQFKNMWQETIY